MRGVLVALAVGLLFGFLGSMPVAGPASALVLSRGLVGRYLSGVMIGIGCSIAEGVYAFLAFWGFATFLAGYPWIEGVSHVVAAVILLALGVTFARYEAKKAKEREVSDRAFPSFALGFWITMLNPALLATWTASATTLSASGFTMTKGSAPFFALGVAIGISSWFSVLTWLLRRYRGRFRAEVLDKVIRVIGVLILGLGLYFAYRAVRHFAG